ncbi:MAG: glucose-6-phosphate isomerase, partial [Cypionkella sp.]
MQDIWHDLATHHSAVQARSILSLFEDAQRFAQFSVQDAGLLFDYSKTNLDARARDLLIALADASGLAAMRDAMFSGAKINETEGRAVLHTALRAPKDAAVFVDGADVMPAIHDTLDRMAAFADAVRNGTFQGQGGAITDV